MSYASPAFMPRSEGFVSHMQGFRAETNKNGKVQDKYQGFKNPPTKRDGFANYSGSPAGARSVYEPIGAFDGVKLETGNNVSSWRYTSPNEALSGNFPKFEPGPDNLFMFKDNQCKPECCGSSYSCGGGCVCTTPEQRDFINHRGGNRTSPESGV